MRSGRDISEAEIASLKKWLYVQAFLDNDNKVQQLSEWDANNPHPQPKFATLRQAEACMAFHLGDQVHNIDHPTFVVHGTEDRIFPVAGAKALSQTLGAKCVVMPDVGHMVPLEVPQEMTASVLQFLK